MRKAQGKRNRLAGLSPRAYQAVLDRRQVWDLVCIRTPQAEIAQIMGKDPAWVCRTIKEIQADFSTVHATPNEGSIIRENLAVLESLYSEARRMVADSNVYSRISAIRVAAEIHRQKLEYQMAIGWVANRRHADEARRGPTIDELRDEISEEDLEAVILISADNIRERQMKAAAAKEVPTLPQPTDTAD